MAWHPGTAGPPIRLCNAQLLPCRPTCPPHLQLRHRLLQLRLVLLRGRGLAAVRRRPLSRQLRLQAGGPLSLCCQGRRRLRRRLLHCRQLCSQAGALLAALLQARRRLTAGLARCRQLRLQAGGPLLLGGQLLLGLGGRLLSSGGCRLQLSRPLGRRSLLLLRLRLQVRHLLPQLLGVGGSKRRLLAGRRHLLGGGVAGGGLHALGSAATAAAATLCCLAPRIPQGRHLSLQTLPVALLHVAQQLGWGGVEGWRGRKEGLAAQRWPGVARPAQRGA